MLLGSKYPLVERYAGWLKCTFTAVAVAVVLLLFRAVRRRACQ